MKQPCRKLQKQNLTGTITPALGNLSSLYTLCAARPLPPHTPEHRR